MTHASKLAREDLISEIIHLIDLAIGEEEPTAQSFRILAAVKAAKSNNVRVLDLARVDYLERVQTTVRAAHVKTYGPGSAPSEHEQAIAGTDTPIGRLKAVTWKRLWLTGRVAWATEYYLDDEPITLAEIKAANLAMRPTTRNRQKRGAKKS